MPARSKERTPIGGGRASRRRARGGLTDPRPATPSTARRATPAHPRGAGRRRRRPDHRARRSPDVGPVLRRRRSLAEFGTVDHGLTSFAVRLARSSRHGGPRGPPREPPPTFTVPVSAWASRCRRSPHGSWPTRLRRSGCPRSTWVWVPGAGGTVSIPRRIGRQRTAWLALTDAVLDASTAVIVGSGGRGATTGRVVHPVNPPWSEVRRS